MRNRQASCCPTSIHGIEPIGAAQPISDAYSWWYAGSKPLQCSGYNCRLTVPLNVLMSRHRSREIEAASAGVSQSNAAESRLYAPTRPGP